MMAHLAGIDQIGKRQLVSKVGDYYVPAMALHTDREVLGDFTSATGWSAFNTDTTGLTTDLAHVLGTASLEFDRVDGAANTRFSGAVNTLSPAVDCSRFAANDKIYTAFYVSSIANIEYAYVRIGTDASNYNEWQLQDVAGPIVPAVWQVFTPTLAETELTVGGNGWNPAAITYIQVGTYHDAVGDALADIRWDHLYIATAQLTTT